eukprot:gene45628-58274_t
MMVAGVAWLCLSKYGWRFLSAISAIPVALTVIFSIYYLPESPRWYLIQGKPDEAKKVIEWTYQRNGRTLTEVFGADVCIVEELPSQDEHNNDQMSPLFSHDSASKFPAESNHPSSGARAEVSYWNIILDKKIRKVTIPLWL